MPHDGTRAARPPRTRERLLPRRLAVDIPAALNLVGALVKWFAPAFLFPAALSGSTRARAQHRLA